MVNLLANAINHSPRGERVEIVLEADSSYQTVKVKDNGADNKPNEIPYLFERIIEVGVQGYCLKGAPSHTLILAIQSVAAGAS